ncbi:MAG: FHA domain-containing protein [Candidatus Latescibacterota bacterium]|nr:MAG: FHA domain-containing protein [Candidatus Latescibacterota bacterium]
MEAKALLEVTTPQGERSIHEVLAGEECTIGRSSASALVLKANGVSRSHARIRFRDGRFRIEDAGSTNGTKVRGEPIAGEVPLEPGDVVEIGGFRLRLLAEDGSEPDPGRARIVDAPASMPLESIVVGRRAKPAGGASGSSDGSDGGDLIRKAEEVGKSLLVRRTPGELYQHIVDLVGEVFGPDRCVLLLGEENLETKAVFRSGGSRDREILISRSIASLAIRERRAILIEDAVSDERFRDQQSVIVRSIGTAMCAPLWDDNRVIGLLYADSPSAGRRFRRDDLHLFSLVGHLAAVKIGESEAEEELERRRQMEKELRQAAEIQRQLLPEETLLAGGFSVAGRNEPCLGVGGDYFDFLETSDGGIVLALGDVSGKGMSAALLMSTLHANVRAFLDAGLELDDVAARLNRFIHQRTKGGRFATLFLAKIDRDSGRVRYVNAGHNFPLLLGPDGRLERLDVGGVMVGAFPDARHEVAETTMEPGSVLLVYSDGVCDATGPGETEFGDERVEALLRQRASDPPDAIVDGLMRAVREYAEDEHLGDDVTVVAVRRS